MYDKKVNDTTGKGEFYTAPKKKKSRGQVGVDGTDEQGRYYWNEDGEKIYEDNLKQYGGYQEGDEVYMSPEEVSQFMAAGGQIEFL